MKQEEIYKVKRTPTAHHYELFLDGDVEEVNNYREWFAILNTAQPCDKVTIHVNSRGGYLDTCIPMCNSIKTCKAEVKTVLEGIAYSAGSCIFLAGHVKEVLPHSTLMAHDAAMGTHGKVNESAKQLASTQNTVASFYKEIYKGFLDKKEIEDVLEGKDIYLSAKEIKQRLDQA